MEDAKNVHAYSSSVRLLESSSSIFNTEDEHGVSKELGANVQHLKLVIPGFNEAISLSNSKLSVSITQLLLEVVIHFEGRFILSFVHNVGTDVHDDNSQDTP